jgi:hypothetical protein
VKNTLWEKARVPQKPRKSISLGRLKKLDRKRFAAITAKKKMRKAKALENQK